MHALDVMAGVVLATLTLTMELIRCEIRKWILNS